MALDQLPPWIDVHPGQFVQAVEAGNKTGLDLAALAQRGQISADELAQRKSESEAEQGLQQQKLALTQSEGAAERALRQNLQQHAQELAQQKFGTNVMLREAGQQIQRARAETAAHAAIIQAMQRQKNEEDLKAYRESEQADRTKGLSLAEQRLQIAKDRQQGKTTPTTVSGELSDPNNLFGGKTTIRGTPENVAKIMGTNAPEALRRLAGNQVNQFPPPPPVSERKSGQVYQTPKGLFTWTGNGWQTYKQDAGTNPQ